MQKQKTRKQSQRIKLLLTDEITAAQLSILRLNKGTTSWGHGHGRKGRSRFEGGAS